MLNVIDFALSDYESVWQQQQHLVQQRIADDISDTLLIGEHSPVITLGRKRHSEANVLNAGNIPVLAIERGGDVTFHGPGQLVAYPIIKLVDQHRDLHGYLRQLEEAVIMTLKPLGLNAYRDPQRTGVWVNGYKVASIGVAVRQWVTYHGLALNVCTNLDDFTRINPCGFEASIMRNVISELEEPPEGLLEALKHSLTHNLKALLPLA